MTAEFTEKIRIAELAFILYEGSLSHAAAIIVARDAGREAVRHGPYGSIGTIGKKQGRPIEYSFDHFLRLGAESSLVAQHTNRVWLAGALITLGDALDRMNYIDRSPLLELTRHLRHGVAHGNKFRIDRPDGLKKFPAHNRDSPVRGWDTRIFEILPKVDGENVLFDFMEAGDVIEHLLAVHLYVSQLVDKETSSCEIQS